MSVNKRIYEILAADSDINGIVGDRIHANIVPPRASMPAITYQHISSGRQHDLNGPIGLNSFRIQINAWSKRYSETEDLADKIITLLNGYSE